MQAEGEFRTRASNVGLFYVRNAEGHSGAAVVAGRDDGRRTAPTCTLRYNEYRAAEINATLAHGYSTQQGMQALEEVFAQTMPREMGFDYAGMSYQEKVAAEGVPPRGHLRPVPARRLPHPGRAVRELVAALRRAPRARPSPSSGRCAALWLRGFDTDVFSQIGLVMIIGLAAKNAILIVEFSKAEHERGASLADAALAGARLRLRPILMTALRLHSRRAAPRRSPPGPARRLAAHPGHDRAGRHARRHVHRHLHHSGHVLREPAIRPARAPAAVPPSPRPDGPGRRAPRPRDRRRDAAMTRSGCRWMVVADGAGRVSRRAAP